jgi:hypothetical protein
MGSKECGPGRNLLPQCRCGRFAATAFDETTGAVSAHSSDVASLAWFVAVAGVLAIMGLVVTLLEWEQVGPARNISRSLVLFAFLLGFVAAVLFYARRWGVHIEACLSWISPTRWNGRAPPARLTPSSERASSLCACGLR